MRRLLGDPDVHQPSLLISTGVSWVSLAVQMLGAFGTKEWDGHHHLVSRQLRFSCLISPARSSVQLRLLSPVLYCSSWRHLQSWRLQCFYSLFCCLSTLPRHSWMMMPGTCTPKTGLHSHPEQLFPSLAGINA